MISAGSLRNIICMIRFWAVEIPGHLLRELMTVRTLLGLLSKEKFMKVAVS